MGAVYVVEHINTGGLWALKVMLDCTRLQAERASRFRREARASARITSEHVVKVTDADTAAELDGAPFIVMELLDGLDVERLLAKRQRLDVNETVDILAQVARGLDKAHAAGVIHRDLKPENIFVHRREDGSTIVKVLDFGISKVLRPDGDMASASVTGASDVMGTPLYMAPEQATARHDQVGPPTDVWAIGLMAVRMLTGAIYWQGDTIAEVFVQIMSDRRWPPSSRWPELGPAFDAWFQKSTAPRPADRFQSVGEQVTELSVILTGERRLLRSSNPNTSPSGQNESTRAQQLVTQVMSVSDKSSGHPMAAAVGVSTAEPVTSASLPLTKPGRGLALVALVAVLAVGALIAVPTFYLRSRDTAVATRDSGALDPSSTSTTASGAGGTPSATSPPMTPTSTTSVSMTSTPTGTASASSASSGSSGNPVNPNLPVVPVVNNGNPNGNPVVTSRPLRPLQPVSPTQPVTPPATSTTKPPPKPGDLFDTQK